MRASTARSLALGLALAAGASACRVTPAGPAFRKTTLARLPRTYRKGTLAVNDDATRVAYVTQTAEGQRVVGDAAPGTLFHECGSPRFGANGVVRYWAVDATGTTPHVVLVAGERAVPTEVTRRPTLVTSKDGRRWAVAAATAVAGPVVIFADGTEVARHPDTSLPVFGPDDRLAFLARTSDREVALVIDGTVRRTFPAPETRATPPFTTAPAGPSLQRQYNLLLEPDGHWVVVAHDREGWAVFRDDVRLASYAGNAGGDDGSVRFDFGDDLRTAPTVLPNSLATAEQAAGVVWWERLGGTDDRWRVVRDGTPLDAVVCARPWTAQPPVLSPDGRHVAYPCFSTVPGRQEDLAVHLDGRSFGPYREVYGVALSGDGQHVAFAASTGDRQWFLVHDRTAGTRRYDAVWRPRLNRDGSVVAWEAERDRRYVLLLGRREITHFDEVAWGPEFRTERGPSWVIRRGRRVVRLDWAR